MNTKYRRLGYWDKSNQRIEVAWGFCADGIMGHVGALHYTLEESDVVCVSLVALFSNKKL